MCVSGSAKSSMNELLVKELEKLMNYYQNNKDKGRMFGYRKAISAIRSLKFEISSVKDVENLAGIGSKTKGKIKELLENGTISKVEKIS